MIISVGRASGTLSYDVLGGVALVIGKISCSCVFSVRRVSVKWHVLPCMFLTRVGACISLSEVEMVHCSLSRICRLRGWCGRVSGAVMVACLNSTLLVPTWCDHPWVYVLRKLLCGSGRHVREASIPRPWYSEPSGKHWGVWPPSTHGTSGCSGAH